MLPPTNTAYVPTLPIPAPTGEPNFQTAVTIVCERDPCASVSAGYTAIGGAYSMLAVLEAPDCSTVNFDILPSSGWFVVPSSGTVSGFCLFVNTTVPLRNLFRSATIIIFALCLASYLFLTMRRIGDL
jgi:hypothetical protein